jgi:uncharacterized membrane protein YqgA involved in biofilm formation
MTGPLSRLGACNVLFVLGSVLIGGLAGEWLRIEDRREALGVRLERLVDGKAGSKGGGG